MFEFGASGVAGALYGAAPFAAAVAPPPPIATDTKTQYAQEHRVGSATGEIAGGAYQMATGAQLTGTGGGGAVGSGGVLTVPAAVAVAGGVGIMYSGAVAVTKGGAVLVNEVAAQVSGGGPDDRVRSGTAERETAALRRSTDRSIRSLESILTIHEGKLEAFREDPFKVDNRGDRARNAGRPDIQQRIIDGRIRHLEAEIRNFERQLELLRSMRSKL